MERITILISIKPSYAKMIYKGIKTVELRRRFPLVEAGYIYLYETIPQQSITGMAKIDRVLSGQPHEIMMRVLKSSGISRLEFNNYFSGSKAAHGIFIYEVLRFNKPVPLRQLRAIWSEFHPPQNYRYLNNYDELKLLEAAC
ncbi:MAG: hypothetical protein HQK98_06935 [Nitrospirae bacterium]|nr:hypothetical protein [Nitrospirota bacterium]